MANSYNNFVKALSVKNSGVSGKLNGKEAQKIYLEEIGNIDNHTVLAEIEVKLKSNSVKQFLSEDISDKEIFLAVQNNDIDTLRRALNRSPEKINLVDSFGWSLLMIACQANATLIVNELLKQGVDITVRDKAGNSARSLVIANKNFKLAELLLKHNDTVASPDSNEFQSGRLKYEYKCDICLGKIFPDRNEHLVSTIHNINASKGKQILPNFVIPESNKGYQIMLKVGWDKKSGLGPSGEGKKYPIKAKMKKDKKGFGHKDTNVNVTVKDNQKNKKAFLRQHENSRRQEINFRREFY